jgi:cytoskeletal protein CcmA (bactofilin family)
MHVPEDADRSPKCPGGEENSLMEQSQPGWAQRVLRRSAADAALPTEAEIEVEQAVPQGPEPAIIEQGCTLEGKLVMNRPIRIEGELKGSVISSESVLVTESGTVEGDITARSVEVRGAVVGSLTGSREVILHPGGKLHGDVETSSFVVERGAYFNGSTRMRLPQHTSRGLVEPLPL